MERLYVKRMLENLSPKALREHSVKDYHVKGVHYLCLERSEAITTKVYVLNPQLLRMHGDHGFRMMNEKEQQRRHESMDRNLANPHNHRYHFKTTVLAGEMVNKVFQERDIPEKEEAFQLNYHQWHSSDALHQDLYLFWKFAYFYQTNEFERMHQVLLEPSQFEYLRNGESYELSPEKIHTIQVSDRECTILFLQQFPNVKGLYSRYSEKEANELRRKILELI
ncbi:hypothetical protein FDP41_005747 [Naegleria fowleri]|uniref:Uncharacterized protein n=1 Tax=Naegleria fowleri TaxID=5763 RepID=A0A6A5BLQ7_NAEFO|nr:uncharacterized protein FDP41_005747 [Naegleria fowleri]KAF0974994.1 hypothetical protein FDP41_005747 [Naegleria fowleri]